MDEDMRSVDDDTIKEYQKRTNRISGELADIPHLLLCTATVNNSERAWLHVSSDLTQKEMLNVLSEFFRYSEELQKVARAALDIAEGKGVHNGKDIPDEIKDKIREAIKDELGENIEITNIEQIGHINTNTGEGLSEFIDNLERDISKIKGVEGIDKDTDINALLKKILGNNEKGDQ